MLEERSILQLPIDELGLEVLRDFDRTGQWNDYDYVNEAEMLGTASQPSMRSLRRSAGFGRVVRTTTWRGPTATA